MQSITELAAARQAAYDLVENSTDETDEANMAAIYSIEKRILRQFRRVKTPDVAMALHRQILCQFGKPDWADNFVQVLGQRILAAI
jgi:hypothetical protein